MDLELGSGWADAVSKILRMGKNNPESNRILSKAKIDHNSDGSDSDDSETNDKSSIVVTKQTCLTTRLRPDLQKDALLENELRDAATRGVVHLFNAVKTVNPKSDKNKKKKKKKKLRKGKKGMKRRRLNK